MQLQLITPEKVLFAADVSQVQIPGTLGEFGVLPGHAPFVSTIKPGVIRIEAADGANHKIAIAGGVAEVTPERCTVLAESAINVAGITAADADGMMQSARDAMDLASTDVAKKDAQNKMALAEAVAQAV